MRNEEPNARWDIYALGVVLYETYSGKRFLERMSEHQIVAHVAYVPDWKLVLDYPQPPPEAFGRVIEGCLERDPERRIASAAELGRRLEECRRETIGTQLDKLERLEKRMGVLGVPRVESRQMEALRARLSAIAERDAAGEHEEALDRLSSLWGQIGEAQQEQEASVREWFERGVAELRTRWQELAGRAGAFLPQPTAEQFEQLLDTVERAVADGEWERARSGLEQGRALPEQAEEAARREAERTVQATLGDALSKLDELKRADKAEIPAGFDVEAVQGQAKVHMNEGHYATAQQEAEAAVATLAATLERIREQEIERTKFLAAQVKTLRRVVDPAATHPAVATELSVGRRAEVRAQQAEQQSDYHEAAAAYEAARAAYQAVAERLTEEQERELAGGESARTAAIEGGRRSSRRDRGPSQRGRSGCSDQCARTGWRVASGLEQGGGRPRRSVSADGPVWRGVRAAGDGGACPAASGGVTDGGSRGRTRRTGDPSSGSGI